MKAKITSVLLCAIAVLAVNLPAQTQSETIKDERCWVKDVDEFLKHEASQSKHSEHNAAGPEFLSDVRHGMKTDQVLAGLKKHYVLKKEGFDCSDCPEAWLATSRDETNPEKAEIFTQN